MDYERQHATLYAEQAYKRHMYQKYLQMFPDLFTHVHYQERLADTDNDYYVPPSLKDQCWVVEKLEFNEEGCRKIACFSYKHDLSECNKGDSARWLRIGMGFTAACQPACQLLQVDTEYRDGKCMEMNIYKKLLALFPESLFGYTSRHNYHSGIDIVNGNIRLNKNYCQVYGLGFDPITHDCVSSTGQQIGEFFVGSTIYRSASAVHVQPKDLPPFPPAPPMTDLDWIDTRQTPPAPRIKRAIPDDLLHEPFPIDKMAQDMAIETGLDITVDQLAKYLKTQVPKALKSLKTQVALRWAIGHRFAQSTLSAGARMSRLMGKGLSTATLVFAVVGLATMFLDTFDPFDYNKVLRKSHVDKLNTFYDHEFFGWGQKAEPVIPERIWQLLENSYERTYIEYITERIQEYRQALQTLPDSERSLKPLLQIPPPRKIRLDPYLFVSHVSLFLLFVLLSLLYLRYFDYVVMLVFFLFVYVYTYSDFFFSKKLL